MNVLITGASGKLGKALANSLELKEIFYIKYSHTNKLDDIDWHNIDTIINCAGVIPSLNVKPSDYYDGNVFFLQNLIAFCSQKNLIHFSTFSELYRNTVYQKSKMLANSLLLINVHLFKKLTILPLPTLDDDQLISSIIKSAHEGRKPIVDDLDYNYLSFDAVAKYVTDGIVSGFTNHISEGYIKKNLYTEICKYIHPELIIKGRKIDRHLKNTNHVYTICPNLLSSLQFP